MKKQYTKPVIIIEDFSLCTNIATCEVKTDLQAYESCGWEMGPDVVFVSETTGCDGEWTTDQGDYNGICYHVFDETNNLFNS